MSSTLGQLKIKLNYALGTSETNLYTNDKRTAALNKALEHLVQIYPISQYTVDTTLAFTSGVANLPTDFNRCLKMWNSTNIQEYVLVTNNDFDNNLSNTFTIKWNTVASLEKVYIYSADTVTLAMRYIQMPATLTGDSDTIRVPGWWDDGLIELAAKFLFTDTRNFDAARAKDNLAQEHLSHAWTVEQARYQDPRLLRLESRFESISMFNDFNDNSNIV